MALELALHGGEDYELLFAARPGAVDVGRISEETGVPLHRVGRVVKGSGVSLDRGDGTPVALTRGGFDHLAGDVG